MAEHSVEDSVHLTFGLDRRNQRPGVKRVYHTWHGETTTLSHFEDFMLEIGADPQAVHLCCVPRQGLTPRPSHKRSKLGSDKKPAHDRYASLSSRISQHALAGSTSKAHDSSFNQSLNVESNAPQKRTFPSTRSKRRTPSTPLPFISASAQQLKARPLSVSYPCNCSASPAASVSPNAARNSLQAVAHSCLISYQVSHNTPTSPETPDAFSWGSNRQEHDNQNPGSEPILSTSSASTITFRSRTSSFASLATASSSEGPETPRAHSPLLSPSQELYRSLSDVEQSTRFRVPTHCATCRRSGSNFPSCPKCGDVWCSRHCRIASSKDGRHSCHCRTVEPSVVVYV